MVESFLSASKISIKFVFLKDEFLIKLRSQLQHNLVSKYS